MKTRNLLILALLIITPLSTTMAEEGVDEFSFFDSPTFFQTFQQIGMKEGENLDYRVSRLRFFSDNEEFWGWYLEFELGAIDSDTGVADSNWLNQVWTSQHFGNIEVREGRIFSGPGNTTYWPGGYHTSRYPSVYPWGFHFWGVQVVADYKHHVWMFDVGARTGNNFDDDEAFNGPESGLMYKWKPSWGYVGIAVQKNETSQSVGSHFNFTKKFAQVTGGLFHTDKDQKRDMTGIITARAMMYPWSKSESKLFVVAQQEWRKNDITPYTLGVGLETIRYCFVIDYDSHSGWGARAQYLVKIAIH